MSLAVLERGRYRSLSRVASSILDADYRIGARAMRAWPS